MASTRPPGTYSPSARIGRRGGESGGVAGMVPRAGSDAVPMSLRSTAAVDSSAASIRRRNRPNTAFRFPGCFDMRNPLQNTDLTPVPSDCLYVVFVGSDDITPLWAASESTTHSVCRCRTLPRAATAGVRLGRANTVHHRRRSIHVSPFSETRTSKRLIWRVNR